MPSHSSYSYVMFIMIHFITVAGALSPIRWLVIYGFRHFLKKNYFALRLFVFGYCSLIILTIFSERRDLDIFFYQ